MHVREPVRLGDAETLEDAQDHERRETLGGRREVVRGAVPEPESERLRHPGAVPVQIIARDRTADAFEIRRDGPCERASIEGVRPVARNPAQRRPETRVHEPVAHRGNRARGNELLGESGNVVELRPLASRVRVLARGNRHTLLRVVDGVREKPIERVRAAPAPADLERRSPSRHRTRDGIRGKRPAARDGVEPPGAVPLRCGPRRGRAARIDCDRLRTRGADDPEPVSSDGIHVRVHDRDGRGCCDHRLDGVAAIAQNPESRLRGQVVGGDDHAPRGGGGADHRR